MLTTANLIEAAGVIAAVVVVLCAGLCIVANAAFRARGLPSDDQEEV